MTTLTLNYAEAVVLLDAAVAAKGADYVYPGAVTGTCVYFEAEYSGAPLDRKVTTVPSCIVGHVLATKDVTSEVLEAHGVSRSNAFGVISTLDTRIDPRTQTLLNVAQSEQDTGVPWGLAVQRAKDATSDMLFKYVDGNGYTTL